LRKSLLRLPGGAAGAVGDERMLRIRLEARRPLALAANTRDNPGVTTPNVKNSTLRPPSHRCGCRERPESPELPLREPPGCLPRVVPGEIKVLPSDGRGIAKRLVVDLNAMFPQGGHQYALLTSSFHRRLDAILSRDQPLAYYF